MLDESQGCSVGHDLIASSEQPPLATQAIDTAPPPDEAEEVAHMAWKYELEARLEQEEDMMAGHDRWLNRHQRLALQRHVAARSKHQRPQPSRRRHIARIRESALIGAGIELRIVSQRYPSDKRSAWRPKQT